MIDFSTLQGMTIPEGAVTQIADASGRVLWKKAPSGATITLSFVRNGGGGFNSYARVTIDGVNYPLNENDLTTTALIVPVGTVITCMVTSCNTAVSSQKITLNGATVASGNSEYLYTVVGDATIKSTINTSYSPMTGAVAYGTIAITEL